MLGARGKRSFKSPEYVEYQEAIGEFLKDVEWPFGINQVTFEVEGGFSNRGADLDNIDPAQRLQSYQPRPS